MQVYQATIKVKEEDLDEHNHVNNVRYVQWVQDIAKAHWFDYASTEIKEKNSWVLMSHLIEYKGAALLGDIIKQETHIKSYQGASCIRIVKMYLNDKCIVNSETKWCLLSNINKRPTRILPEIAELFA